MNALLTNALFAVCLAASASAQTPPAGETVGQLAHSAESRLSESIAELNKLRQQVAEEKLPLAQDLTALELSLIHI